MDTKTLAYAELLDLAIKAAPEFMETVKKELGYKTRAVKANDSYRNNLPILGKLLCVQRSRFEEMRKNGAVRRDAKFNTYFENLYGEKTMDTQAYSLSITFSAYVLTDRITEEEYDELIPVDALQRASRILSAVNDDLEHPAIAEAVTLLKKRSKKLLKELAELQSRIVETTDGEGEKAITKIVLITKEELEKRQANPGVLECQPIADQLSSSSTGLSAMLSAILAVAHNTSDAGTAQTLCQYPARLDTALGENTVENADKTTTRRFSTEQLFAWRSAGEAPRNITEDDKRADYAAAVALVTEIEESLNANGIDPSDWTDGKASLLGETTPATAVAV
jgi:hypothetical protein